MSVKTNVMRILDKSRLKYSVHSYADTEAISGVEVASILGQPVERVFKTLVTQSAKQKYVFIIPVAEELDLKKAAKAVSEKSIDMLKSKDLFPLTGYVHGGCSPIGMKKFFPTVIHSSAEDNETIFFSAGKIGYQIEMSPADLAKVIRFEYGDIIV